MQIIKNLKVSFMGIIVTINLTDPKKITTLLSTVLLMMALSSCNKISPKAMTVTAMGANANRIRIYEEKHGKLPDDLGRLPKREGYTNRITDGWDRKLLFEIEKDGSFKLRSLGKDGVVRGENENRDITRHYAKDKDGDWIMTEKP